MATKSRICEKCGKELNQQQKWRGKKYCSRRCFNDARWGDAIQFGEIKTRSKGFIEAAKLCQSGLSQAEAARALGICPRMVSDWFERYGADKIITERACAYCGKSLAGMKRVSNRKYCSESCSGKAEYARKHPVKKRKEFDPELRAGALELYWDGLGGTAISEHLDVPDGTVRSWIHDFGHLRKRRRKPEVLALRSVKERLSDAKSPEEWKQILREGAPGDDLVKTHLVCGTFNGWGEINHLASIVYDILKRDPRDGDVYAVCSRYHDQISTICWRGGAFRFSKLPKKRGKYIWPGTDVGLQVEVNENEFEYLLSLEKNKSRKPEIA